MNRDDNIAVTVTDSDFEWFRNFFGEKTGIYFEENKRYFVDRRLQARVRFTHHRSTQQYLTFVQLQESQAEFQELVNLMTVNETYFYREDYQFDALVNVLLDDIVLRKAPGAPIRIWSIPCSTGEEPYSLAIYLLENWSKIAEVDVEIVGSDINTEVLELCKEGVYSQRSVKNLPDHILRKYFKPRLDGTFSISNELRAAISFTQVNLANPEETRGYRNFDIALCRNLLIYFNDESRREAIDTLYGALKPGGYIFLGHSESMSRISSLFKVTKASSAMIYQKPLGGLRP